MDAVCELRPTEFQTFSATLLIVGLSDTQKGKSNLLHLAVLKCSKIVRHDLQTFCGFYWLDTGGSI